MDPFGSIPAVRPAMHTGIEYPLILEFQSPVDRLCTYPQVCTSTVYVAYEPTAI
jgi:hypothetical protein